MAGGNEYIFGLQRFGRRMGYIPHLKETTKHYQRRGHFWPFLFRRGIQAGIILGDNSAGHCFVL